MATLLLYILIWVLTIVVVIVFVLLIIWMVTGFRAKVPFVPVPDPVLKDIYKILDIKDTSVLYDLGCGDGKVLFYIAKRVPKARYIGIENVLFPLILAHAKAWWNRTRHGTKIEILNQDFFQHDLSLATHIFTYLYPNVMDDLLPKLDKELKPGTKLVSATFKFTLKQPVAEFDLGRASYKLARKIFVYQF
jgi:cyclopropane fatty-acyl-phospholipid synthase-like methyltransferase